MAMNHHLLRNGTRLPVVVLGPEGCGRTSWLRQG
ncbi:MAG: ATP-binding protein [Thermosphaera sp.]|nr:ATP-binding protein [Thermosphaera sp.]